MEYWQIGFIFVGTMVGFLLCLSFSLILIYFAIQGLAHLLVYCCLWMCPPNSDELNDKTEEAIKNINDEEKSEERTIGPKPSNTSNHECDTTDPIPPKHVSFV